MCTFSEKDQAKLQKGLIHLICIKVYIMIKTMEVWGYSVLIKVHYAAV